MISRDRLDQSPPYLAILLERHPTGHARVHAGLARYGRGRALCNDRQFWEFAHPMLDPQFSLDRPAGWRHRYAEAYLELNRGCPECLNILYQLGREAGWAKPKKLAV